MANPTTKVRLNKPSKPYPDFPLFPHATKRWAKKIRGKTCYFGPWDNPQAALQKYLDERDDLHAGRTPRVKAADGLTIVNLCNRFLTEKKHLVDSRDLSETTFRNYYVTCERLVKHFGRVRLVDDLVADDFSGFRRVMAQSLASSSLGLEIMQTRILLKWAYDSGLIEQPVRFGQSFNRPSRKRLRQDRQANGKRLFDAGELLRIMDASDSNLKTMVLLAINCGFGQTDIANLPRSAVDLENGWIEYPRPKTAVERRNPLWPETVAALQSIVAQPPNPKTLDENNGLVFVTKHGKRWVEISDSEKRAWKDSIGKKFGILLKHLGLQRPRLNFYAIRHTFATIAGSSKDQVAVNAVMGHVDSSMAAVYRESIDDDRLIAVTDTVHRWLFSGKKGGAV